MICYIFPSGLSVISSGNNCLFCYFFRVKPFIPEFGKRFYLHHKHHSLILRVSTNKKTKKQFHTDFISRPENVWFIGTYHLGRPNFMRWSLQTNVGIPAGTSQILDILLTTRNFLLLTSAHFFQFLAVPHRDFFPYFYLRLKQLSSRWINLTLSEPQLNHINFL